MALTVQIEHDCNNKTIHDNERQKTKAAEASSIPINNHGHLAFSLRYNKNPVTTVSSEQHYRYGQCFITTCRAPCLVRSFPFATAHLTAPDGPELRTLRS